MANVLLSMFRLGHGPLGNGGVTELSAKGAL